MAPSEAGGTADAFEATEASVLRWLLSQADVAEALDLALAGDEEKALPQLLRSVEVLLDGQGVGAVEGAAEEDEAKPEALETAPSAGGKAARKRSLEEVSPGTHSRKARRPLQRQRSDQEWIEGCQEALGAERAAEARRLARLAAQDQAGWGAQAADAAVREPVPLYWKIELPDVKKILRKGGALPEHLTLVEDPHITLLYLGAEGDEAAAKRLELTVEDFQSLRLALEALDGQEVEVQLTRVLIEERIACASVWLPPYVPCGNACPHMTLGTKMGVPPRYANELMEQVNAGRTDGFATIDFPAPRKLTGRVSLQFSSNA